MLSSKATIEGFEEIHAMLLKLDHKHSPNIHWRNSPFAYTKIQSMKPYKNLWLWMPQRKHKNPHWGGTVLTYTKNFLQTFQANLQHTITYFKRFTKQVDPVTLSHTKRLKSEKIYISKKKHRKGNKLPNAIFLFFFLFFFNF